MVLGVRMELPRNLAASDVNLSEKDGPVKKRPHKKRPPVNGGGKSC